MLSIVPSHSHQKTYPSDPSVTARSQLTGPASIHITTLPVDSSADVKHSLQGPWGGLDPFARRGCREHSRRVLPTLAAVVHRRKTPVPTMGQAAYPSTHPWNNVASPCRPRPMFVSQTSGSNAPRRRPFTPTAYLYGERRRSRPSSQDDDHFSFKMLVHTP